MSEFRYTQKYVEKMVALAVERGLMPADTVLDTAFTGDKGGRYYYVMGEGCRNRRFIGQGATNAAYTLYAITDNARSLLDEKGV